VPIAQNRTEQNRTSSDALVTQVNGLLAMSLNSKNDADLSRMVDERKARRGIDPEFLPGPKPMAATQAKTPEQQKRLNIVTQLAQVGRGGLKLEDHRVEQTAFKNMRRAEKKGKEYFEGYIKDLKTDIAKGHPELYFEKIQRESFRAIPSNGTLNKINIEGVGDDASFSYKPLNTKDPTDPLCKGEVIYALGARGEMFVFPSAKSDEKIKEYFGGQDTQHTSAFSGRAIICGGVLETDKNGVIEHIDNSSGHYKPKGENLAAALKVLKDNGVLYKTTDVTFDYGKGPTRADHTKGSVEQWNIPFRHNESTKTDIKSKFIALAAGPDIKNISNPAKDFIANIDKCQTANQVAQYTHTCYLGCSDKKTPYAQALKDSLSTLLNVKSSDFQNDKEFNKALNDKMKVMVDPKITDNTINRMQKLGEYITAKTNDLSGIKSIFMNTKTEGSKIQYARDALSSLSRGQPLPDHSAAPYNISNADWQKSQLNTLVKGASLARSQQTQSSNNIMSLLSTPEAKQSTSVATAPKAANSQPQAQDKAQDKGKARVLDEGLPSLPKPEAPKPPKQEPINQAPTTNVTMRR
jgi:hypothetical protein